MKKIILASGSPRRREILKKAGLEFEIHPSAYEEVLGNLNFTPEKIETLAYNKALSVANEISGKAIIIGADTVVVLNNHILTKPKDKSDAFNMLKSLSDKDHQVVTGICVINKYDDKAVITHDTTTVRFEELTDKMIDDYIDNFKPFDKAGAYGIQELPDGYVKYVNGSLENVIGLSSKTVLKILNK